MASARSLVERVGRTALDLVFPPRCAVCDGGGAFLCDACAASLAEAQRPRCSRCWRPGEVFCFECRRTPPPFTGLRTAFVHAGNARTLVHALKYRGTTALATPLASYLADVVRRDRLPVDVIVPVPLSGMRRRMRGYNQAEVLARALGRELGLPVRRDALVRRRHTPPQAQSANATERRRNVAGAFAARDAGLQGARVLLLDDVTTTGATMAACAEALRAANVHSIWGLAFARED